MATRGRRASPHSPDVRTEEMTQRNIIGLWVLAIGLLYASFWGLAQRDVNSTRRVLHFSEMPKEQFVKQFPFMNLACSFFHWDPYAPRKDDRQIPESSFVFQGIMRHLWFGIALIFLGGATATFRKPRRFSQVMHYCCVVGFGGALFLSATLHPIISSWHGK